jgi:TRAP-type uncharacterized transport system substrate-binding protein
MPRMAWKHRLSRLPIGGVVLGLVATIVGLVLATFNFGAGLGHVDVAILSGSSGGNYAAVVDRLAAHAAKRGGTITNVPSQGSVDNARRLARAADDCDVHFALIQDGVPLPDSDDLRLIGRLPRRETVFVLGRDAARLTRFAELQGMRIGIGPTGSGADHLARSVFETDELQPLALQLTNHELTEQLELVASGGLDLGVFVMDENAQLIRTAIRDRGLQLASFEHLGVIPTRVPFVSVGTIEAGQYDALAVIPQRDHAVLRVDTLLVGNGCASRSEEVGVLEVLVDEMPGFLAVNKELGGGSLNRSDVAKEYYVNEGPGFADEYIPWLVDIMPLGNWLYIAMSLSVLFNVMTLGHKIRLWRVDANRDKAFQIVRDALGEELTPAEIAVLEPTDEHRAKRDRIDAALHGLDALRIRTRRQENSILVPMGHEWMYRYEEEQIESLLTALRGFRAKLS